MTLDVDVSPTPLADRTTLIDGLGAIAPVTIMQGRARIELGPRSGVVLAVR